MSYSLDGVSMRSQCCDVNLLVIQFGIFENIHTVFVFAYFNEVIEVIAVLMVQLESIIIFCIVPVTVPS